MHQRKSKKILIYFLLLVLVCSINNERLNKIEFSNISDVEILGLGDRNNKSLLENIYNLNLGNILFANKKKIQQTIELNSLVEKYDVFKIYPSSLYIKIQKTKFLAKVNYNGVNYIIGSNGKLSKDEFYQKQLPFIFGSPNIKEFLKLKEIIDNSKFDYKNVENFYYFANRRWDLELANEIIIKLPEKNLKKSLELAFDFLKIADSSKIKFIDLRVNNQIILND